MYFNQGSVTFSLFIVLLDFEVIYIRVILLKLICEQISRPRTNLLAHTKILDFDTPIPKYWILIVPPYQNKYWISKTHIHYFPPPSQIIDTFFFRFSILPIQIVFCLTGTANPISEIVQCLS